VNSSWRDTILNDFVPNVSKLTLVADPDNLLTEEKLALELRQRGFDLIEFNDPVEFRYAYESKYRSLWDRGDHFAWSEMGQPQAARRGQDKDGLPQHTDLIVVLRLQDAELEALPYDLLQAGRKLSFSLGDLFPHLSYPVIEKLDRSLLDALFEAQKKSPSDRLGNNATKDLILRYVFGITTELMANEVELLRTLLRLHYGKTQIPRALSDRLVQVLKGHGGFYSWPLEEIVPDEEAFFAFLQERWPLFLSRLNLGEQVREGAPKYVLKYPGPDVLPFDHQDIRVYIDNLFVEGKLMPVQKPEVAIDTRFWIRSGVIEAGAGDDEIRISRLFELVDKGLPTLESRYSDWIAFALKWAELSALVHCGQSEADKSRLWEVGDALNATFAQWLSARYASLINLPPTHPAMLHHVPRCLARKLEDAENGRVALLVIDGLALDQWITIRQILQEQDRRLVMRESAIFAWIPTLTSVSRQAIFSGKPPLYFPLSINSTNSEGNLWKQFWEGAGFSRLDIAYQRGLSDGDVANVLDATLHPGRTKAAGLIVDKVDKIMHGMQLGAAGMHNQIKQWCRGGFLGSLIGYLLDHGYEVWMTSDHGNIECRGRGRPSEGVIAETRGERVRVYPTPELRAKVARKFSFAHKWQPIGLPSNYFPLVAGGNDAFVNPGDSIVGHGGIAIEEVIVPLVKFERKTR
jgi:hypothetical protein